MQYRDTYLNINKYNRLYRFHEIVSLCLQYRNKEVCSKNFQIAILSGVSYAI